MDELLPTLKNAGCMLLASHFECGLSFMPDTPCLRYQYRSFRPLSTPTALLQDAEFCDFSLDFGVHSRCDQALRELPTDNVARRHRLSRIAKHSRKLTRNLHKSRAAAVHWIAKTLTATPFFTLQQLSHRSYQLLTRSLDHTLTDSKVKAHETLTLPENARALHHGTIRRSISGVDCWLIEFSSEIVQQPQSLMSDIIAKAILQGRLFLGIFEHYQPIV